MWEEDILPNEICGLIQLLTVKQELLSCLEKETQQLLDLPMEQLEACLQRRQALLDRLAKTGMEIVKECENRERLQACVSMQCDMTALSVEEEGLMDLLLAVHARSNRITKLDFLVFRRLETERDAIKKKLERLNTSGAAVAEKYYQSTLQTHLYYGTSNKRREI